MPSIMRYGSIYGAEATAEQAAVYHAALQELQWSLPQDEANRQAMARAGIQVVGENQQSPTVVRAEAVTAAQLATPEESLARDRAVIAGIERVVATYGWDRLGEWPAWAKRWALENLSAFPIGSWPREVVDGALSWQPPGPPQPPIGYPAPPAVPPITIAFDPPELGARPIPAELQAIGIVAGLDPDEEAIFLLLLHETGLEPYELVQLLEELARIPEDQLDQALAPYIT